MNAKKIIDFNIYWFLVTFSRYNDRAKKKLFCFRFFWSKSHYNGDLKLKKKSLKITLL